MMQKISVIFWSGSGNTEKMAALIAEGAGTVHRHISEISDPSADADLPEADVVAIGCPALGDEGIDEVAVAPFMTKARDVLKGKKIALFGSYGWGGGAWLKKWAETLRADGLDVLDDVMAAREAPDAEASKKCVEFGKKLKG